jgi:hypothetical protein
VSIYDTDNPLIFEVSYEDIESGDITTVLTALRGFLESRNTVVGGKRRVTVLFEGYDDDPRDVYDIPEIRRYAKALDDAFPYWFYFASLHDGSTLQVFALCLCRVIKAGGGSKPHTDDYKTFLFLHIAALNELCERFKLGDTVKLQVTDEVLAHLAPTGNSPDTRQESEEASLRERKDNKWRHGATRFEIPALDDYLGMRDGFLPLPVVLDAATGEEVALFVRDQTPFMAELRQVHPFRLMMKQGCARNEFGPLVFFLFWVQTPANPAEPFAAWDCYLDPKNPVQMRLWRTLAAQTHWHLFLVGPRNEQENFFEFENNYGLAESLEATEQACRDIATIDFNRAKDRFMQEHSLDDLFGMQ